MQMLSRLRRAWRAHLSEQQKIVAELQQFRLSVAPLSDRLDAVGKAFAEQSQVICREAVALRQSIAALQQSLIETARWVEISSSRAVEHNVAELIAMDGRHKDPLSLSRYHAQVYSQSGEDGIIAEIFRRIGTRSRNFIEIGIGTGLENNTRFLLEQGWSGVWVEGNPENAKAAAERFSEPVAAGRIKVITEYATPEDIDSLLDAVDVPEEVDFLSLDIDQHTTHVWRGLRRRARVSCIEYNASIPPSSPLEVPYDTSKSWNGTNWFGGGLKAIEVIGAAKGLNLVGCDRLGANAFLVDSGETAGKFREPFTAEAHFQSPQFRQVGHLGHPAGNEARVWQEVEP